MNNNLEQKESSNEPNNRIIVYNLNFDTDENGLRDYFSKYGEVLNVEIPISQMQNRSRGFGFVTFSTVEEATKANDPSIVHELNERKVRTSFANKREKERDEEYKVKKLYIGKLPKEINENELKDYFDQFGKVKDAFLSSVKFAPLLNGFPQHKGYGFVTFENEEDANKAVKHKSHVIKGANIFVRKAIPQRDEEKSSNSGDRRNKNNSSRNNKGRNNNERRNKEGGSTSSETSTTSTSSSSPQDTTSSTSTTTTQTGTYSPSTSNNNSNNNSNTEKKPVVVKRKDDNNKSQESSSQTTNTSSVSTTSNSNNNNEKKNESNNKSSSNNNDNKKGKSITVNHPPKNTKPVITIQKTSTSNPWKNQQSSTSSQPQSKDFPTLGKKKGTKTTTKTVTTTTVTTTITVDDKDSKDDKEDN